METLDDVPGVLHFLLRRSEHAIRNVDGRGMDERLAIKPKLLSLEGTSNECFDLQALLLKPFQVFHVQIHAIEHH